MEGLLGNRTTRAGTGAAEGEAGGGALPLLCVFCQPPSGT